MAGGISSNGPSRGPFGALMLVLLTSGCAAPSQPAAGQWIGDMQGPATAERMAIDVESNGRSARISLASWGLDTAIAWSIPARAESVAFMVVVDRDTVRIQGIAREGAWIGAAKRGTEAIPFTLRRLHPLADREWRAIEGTYRTEDGRLLGIAPFSEFGPGLLIVDYSTGRIGPLYPIARDRFLVGHSVIAPVFPTDSLELSYGPAGEVRGLLFAEREHPPVRAERMATKDEEVEFRNGPVALRGTLTLPTGPPPHPALVLVHGSNALTRDVFGPWSRFFAGLGFAVLAYDKRGTGHSTGDWKQADFPTLATDVLAGVRFLAARRDVHAQRIGLWGASQAGWIMPVVAAEASGEIAFLVVHAGSGTTVREQGVLYIQHELRFAGLPESSIAVGTRYQMLDDSVTAAAGGWEELQRYYETHRSEEPWLWPPRPADDWFRRYYRMLMDFDPTPSWKRVRCPVLLFFGELDANVPPKASWPPVDRALREGGNRRVAQFLLPGANHLFLEAESGTRDEYPGLSRFVPGYFDRMAGWLASTIGARPAEQDSTAKPQVHFYKTVGGVRLRALVYDPVGRKDRRPAAVLFHGGGWYLGEPEWMAARAQRLASLGMVAVSIQYRLSDQRVTTPLDAMEDARDAIRWICRHPRRAVPRLARVPPSPEPLEGRGRGQARRRWPNRQ